MFSATHWLNATSLRGISESDKHKVEAGLLFERSGVRLEAFARIRDQNLKSHPRLLGLQLQNSAEAFVADILKLLSTHDRVEDHKASEI